MLTNATEADHQCWLTRRIRGQARSYKEYCVRRRLRSLRTSRVGARLPAKRFTPHKDESDTLQTDSQGAGRYQITRSR